MAPPIPATDLGPTPASPLPELPGHSSRGRLERVLRRGEFAITAELNPPDSANPDDVYERVKHFDGFVDGVNATDGSGACPAPRPLILPVAPAFPLFPLLLLPICPSILPPVPSPAFLRCPAFVAAVAAMAGA